MINLTKAPFFLVKEDIEWVENTKKAMTLEEKIGQLFVPIGYSGDADYLEHVMLSHHIGGIMYRCVPLGCLMHRNILKSCMEKILTMTKCIHIAEN